VHKLQTMKRDKEEIISLRNLIIIVVLLWIISAVLSWLFFKEWSNSASFGDTFGAINSLFSGLALAGIIYTIYLQKTELSLQRKELEYTREELTRTADAQEKSVEMMNNQTRLNNLPFLQYNSRRIKGKDSLIISNESENPAFDVDIWLFVIESEDSYAHKHFIDQWIKDEFEQYIDIKKLVDDQLWALSERGIYPSFPKSKKIIIPIDYPIGNKSFEIYIQFRDNLGNNYSQNIYFTSGSSYDKPFQDVSFRPNIPEVIKRIDLTDNDLNEKQLPKIAEGLVDLKKASISGAFLKKRTFSTVEYYWDMVDV